MDACSLTALLLKFFILCVPKQTARANTVQHTVREQRTSVRTTAMLQLLIKHDTLHITYLKFGVVIHQNCDNSNVRHKPVIEEE